MSMKYDASMTQYHSNIATAIKRMCGRDKTAMDLVNDASPVPLREYLKKSYKYNGAGDASLSYSGSPKEVRVEFGGESIILSWSQVTSFIRKYPAEIFNEVKENEVKKTFPCDDCGYDKHGCCNYPDTPDDYCVMGDKQIPAAPTETAAPAQNTFDYSELDADTAAKLENVTAEISNVRKEYIFTMAKKVAYAHGLLANCGNGKFGAWCESVGISRDTGNNLVRIAELFGNSTVEEQMNLNKLTDGNIKLLYEAARPSAPAELVEQIKSGDITTHKEYIELKKQLEAQMQRYSKALDENHSLHSENQSLRRDRANAMNRADNAEHELSDAKAEIKKLSKECERNTELEQRIKSLESQPRDVAVQADPEAERKFSETLRKLNLDFENFRDEADRDLADMRNQRNAALDRAEAAEAQLNAPKAESSIKPFLIKMTMDDFTALIKAVENDPYLKNIIQKAQVIRI